MKKVGFNSTITQRFIGFLLLTSIFPLVVFGLLSYQVAYRVLRHQATAFNQELVKNQRDYLDLQLKQISNLIYNVSGTEEIIQAVRPQQQDKDAYSKLLTQAKIGQILNKSYSNSDGLVSIDVHSIAGDHFHVGETLDTSEIREGVFQNIYHQAAKSDKRIVWLGIEKNVNANSKVSQVIAAAKLIYAYENASTSTNGLPQRKAIGLLLVNYNPEHFYNYFSQIDLGEGGFLILVDAQGRIIYHPDRAILGQAMNSNFLAHLARQKSSYVGKFDGKRMLVTHEKSALSGWVIISFIPMSEFLSGAILIRTTNLAALLTAFTIIIFSALVVSRRFVQPIREITKHFQSLDKGYVDSVPVLPERYNDEVGELIRWFNTFLASLRRQQQVELALRESEQRYALALQGANDGIWDWDLTVNSIHYSDRWKAMVGYSEHEAIDQVDDWLRQIHTDDIGAVITQLVEHLKANLPYFESEHRLLKCDSNQVIWVLVRGLATRDGHNIPTRIAGSMTDITIRKTIEEKLRHDALHDALTNLPNRAYFNQHLEIVLSQHRSNIFRLSAVISLDLDRFKIVNDSLGHGAGDQLLVQVGQCLRTYTRPEDFAARFGGDEFSVLIKDIPNTSVLKDLARRLLTALSSPILLEGHDVSVSASLGITLITDGHSTGEEILRDADTALYHAKATGRDCFAIFDEAMHKATVETLELEASLRRAIEHQEFCLYYQPILSLKQRRVTTFEALIRWQDPERGWVSPGDFIPLAEETGLISTIGAWVIEAACCQGKTWHDQGFTEIKISVNLSARQLQEASLPNVVEQVLRQTQFPASGLQLEITESTAMADFALSKEILSRLQILGVTVVIDDFGTSYSSLGYLKQLPVNGIKIDRSFIQDVPESNDAIAITSAILAMARILGLEVTAEGVETGSQLAFLSAHDCDAVQGFLLGRPTPPSKLMSLLCPDGTGMVLKSIAKDVQNLSCPQVGAGS